jgi:hypothetical protein
MGDMFKKVVAWKHFKEAIVVVLALALYLVGVKFLLLPVLLFLNARYLPIPKFFASWFSRLFVSFAFMVVLLQIAATIQFLAAPHSNFMMLAGLLTLLQVGLWYFIPVQPTQKYQDRKLFDTKDLCALVVAGFFLLPFAPIFAGQNSIAKIAQIGSIEAIDATNHFAGIAEMNVTQHFSYAPSYYYPKGFHIATAFVENTAFQSQFSLGWRGSAVLFFAQYVVLALGLAYALYYLGIGLMEAAGQKVQKFWTKLLLALALGPTLALLYLIPFVNEGFLNYYYVIMTIVLGMAYLVEVKGKQDDWKKFVEDERLRWALFAYLLLAFGASASWPLLIPPLVLVGVLFVLPQNANPIESLKLLLKRPGWPLILVFLLQLVPIYFQLKYSGSDGTQGINLTGGLKQFHPYILLAGAALVLGVGLSKRLDEDFRRLVFFLYMPLLVFIALLVLMQYFATGEIRYYVIKSSILLELLFLVLGVVLLLQAFLDRTPKDIKYQIMIPIFPLAIVLLLLSSLANPLKDVRDLFRDRSHEEKPAFFDQDTSTYTRLATQGDIHHFNSTLLHYDQKKEVFYAHMQIPFWMNMMSYDGTWTDTKALDCVGRLYGNLDFGTFSPSEQDAMKTQLKSCANAAHDRGFTFYIVTDKESAPAVQDTFGSVAKVVY